MGSSRRRLTVVRMGTDSVRIYRDREYDCYQVVTLFRGQLFECEESALDAARDTAAAQCRWIRRQTRQEARQAAIRFVVSCVGLLTNQRLYWQGGDATRKGADGWEYSRETALRFTNALSATDVARLLQRTTHVYVTVEVL